MGTSADVSAAVSRVLDGIGARTWLILDTAVGPGAANMAIDAGLMSRARTTREAVLRVYAWSRPTLSLGRNQDTAQYDRAGIGARGVDVVRRPTGGRAILHWREVTYSVTTPLAQSVGAADVYTAINRILESALSSLGVCAEALPRGGRRSRDEAERRPDSVPCFASPSAGEITAAGAKLVGSAQLVEDGVLLQHGSILLADDQSAIPALTGAGGSLPPPATLESLLGKAPAYELVRDSLFDALADAAGGRVSLLERAEADAHASAELGRFQDPGWTWRR